ncbi:hypothetical protein OEG84_04745 [Hoeflea sp. G2-23]|uniref:Uncharacterized protein n=1 Tax=Hoeflea algicola TaxID=2983763 RepID=A0ABT3Z5Q4_9HYPH|nr:hypothetical protein [Hoeflea algicola]MCY0147044.1 hypothetical protein [Hoeflea algicola]
MPDQVRNSFATTIRDALKLKKVMIARGLTRAQAKCPECDGMVQGRLAGPKNHMRFWCDGTCKRSLME